jgi:hypothetical protein
MKARDLATYFAKKIAKPIPYGYVDAADGITTNYLVEPVALSDGILHVTVTMKNMTSNAHRGLRYGPQPVLCGEVGIPLLDGDSAVSVLEMAVAWTSLRDECLELDEGHQMRIAYEDLKARRDEFMEERPSGPRV